jgi:UPF0176 protein
MKSKKKKKVFLHNRLNKKDAMKILEAENFKRTTVSFYKYVNIKNPKHMRDQLYIMWSELGCLGRIYIAKEGINAQMNVPEHNWDRFVRELYNIPEFTDVPFKIGIEQGNSFWKLNVRLKKQIVADGLDHGEYDIENVGKHLDAKEFNAAMQDPETVVVDMRNHYESEIGHFEGALCHPVDTFREQLPMVAEDIKDAKDKKVLLYCTGGIRCEKASAYLKHKGFKDVNQLHGGVIAYAHQVREQNLDSKFHGSNYVFDERNRENINGEIISHCHQCGNLCDRHVNCQNRACNLLFLQCKQCEEKMDMTCSNSCKKIHNLPQEKRDAYYKKNGCTDQQKFSKSLRAREKFARKSPWQKIVSLFA